MAAAIENEADVLYNPLGMEILREAVAYTFTSQNNQVAILTLHSSKGREYDKGWWVERQNTPSALAVKFGEDSEKMKQERHLELVGLSRWRKELNICRRTSDLPCRTEADALEAVLFPTNDAEPEGDSQGSDAMEAAAFVAERSYDIETRGALASLGLEAMPTDITAMNTVVAERKRSGYDPEDLDDAARIIRRRLFTM
jgi:hypothetical protein